MSKEILIEVKDLHLKYVFFKTGALKHSILKRNKRKKIEFEAISGISFEVEKGINLGIIGSNGSGKSTLLRILAHTLMPDLGHVNIKTNSVSLLSLGVGFKPDLTGHENIYLNGLLLGLTPKELEKKMDEIIEFSELGEFIYNPVRTYSSGMKSKLSFSIAINVNPELLLIDELFSVGDARFKEKSRKKMESMINDDRTVVMVSHNIKMIHEYCQKVLWLEKGKIRSYGEPDKVINDYMAYMK